MVYNGRTIKGFDLMYRPTKRKRATNINKKDVIVKKLDFDTVEVFNIFSLIKITNRLTTLRGVKSDNIKDVINTRNRVISDLRIKYGNEPTLLNLMITELNKIDFKNFD